MGNRKIVEIDRDLCDGCGLCTTACAEGALALDEQGKAVLVREIFCDGMGVCLNVCPTGALTIVEREGPGYDADAAREHVIRTRGIEAAAAVHPGTGAEAAPVSSELTQWPVQLHLVSPVAPCFQGADVLLAADCTAFAMGDFHSGHLRGKALAVACPKLDQGQEIYLEKLTAMIDQARINTLTVLIMEVPCCGGLSLLAQEAAARASRKVPVKKMVVGLRGEIRSEAWI